VSGPAIVWLILGLLTTAMVSAMLIALVRHVFVLGRAIGRFQREVSPIAEEIAAAGERASTRSRRMSAEQSFGRSKSSGVP
jgi:hypothetical protein